MWPVGITSLGVWLGSVSRSFRMNDNDWAAHDGVDPYQIHDR